VGRNLKLSEEEIKGGERDFPSLKSKDEGGIKNEK